MIQIEFVFNKQKTIIQSNSEDIFQDIIDKYINKSSLNQNSVYFIANDNQINPQEKLENQMNEANKETKKLKILVIPKKERNEKEQIFVKSKDIICPKCHEPCRIKINNYHIELYGCINRHITKYIKIKDFNNTQKINISNIICETCIINNKGNSINNEFYKCLTCNENICPVCKPNHDNEHNIIKYDKKNYLCPKHNEYFIKYCKQCNTNICFICNEDHVNHESIFLWDLKPNVDEAKEKIKKVRNLIGNVS